MKSCSWILTLVIVASARAEVVEVESAQVTLLDQVELAAREAGPLVALEVREGDVVAEGDLLARIDDIEPKLAHKKASLEAAIARRQAENDVKVRFARKSLEVATAERKRAEESIEKFSKSVSDTELDRLRLAAERTLLEVEQAELEQALSALAADLKQTEVEAAAASIERRRVVAPLAGVVAQVNHDRGEWVQPGEVIVRIVRLDRLRAEALVPARSIGAKRVGAKVELIVDLADELGAQFTGKLTFVSPEVNPVNQQLRVVAEIDNVELKLRPGLLARLRIENN